MFEIFSKKILGIDIGTTTIKIVEVAKTRQGVFELKNYSHLENYGHLERINDAFQTSGLKLLEKEVAKILRFLLKKMRARTKKVVFSVPIYSVFVNTFEMPPMPLEDLKKALPYQARRLIPFPISEVLLDWFLIKPSPEEIKFRNLNKEIVFLIAFPKELISRYQRISEIADLEFKMVELEGLALKESLIEDKEPVLVLDIGSRVTNFLIYDYGFLRINRFFDLASGDISEIIASGLRIDPWRAEEFKRRVGLKPEESEREISNLIYPIIDSIFREVQKIIAFYLNKTGRKIKKMILSGGMASMPGFLEYSRAQFPEIIVKKANAFAKIRYQKELTPIIEELKTSFGVCNGLALKYLK